MKDFFFSLYPELNLRRWKQLSLQLWVISKLSSFSHHLSHLSSVPRNKASWEMFVAAVIIILGVIIFACCMKNGKRRAQGTNSRILLIFTLTSSTVVVTCLKSLFPLPYSVWVCHEDFQSCCHCLCWIVEMQETWSPRYKLQVTARFLLVFIMSLSQRIKA